MDELFLGGFNDFQLMRRFLFWSLCFCLLFPVGLSSCDGSDSAAVIFGGTTGELTWTLTEDGVLTITGEGPMPAFEITKSETIRLNSKTMKFKPN